MRPYLLLSTLLLFLVQTSGLHALAPQPIVVAAVACKMGGSSCCCPIQCKTPASHAPKAKACHMESEAGQTAPRVVLRSCAPEEQKTAAPQADMTWISSSTKALAPTPAVVAQIAGRDPRAHPSFAFPPLHPPAVPT